MKPIKTSEQHAEALSRFDRLASRGENLTEKQRDELEILAVLIEKYEDETQPVAPPTPIEAIRFRMEQMGYAQKDLANLLGGASRASEILTGKRDLSPMMMRRLRDEWGIPADSLIGGRTPEHPEPETPEPDQSPAWDPGNYPMKQMYDRAYFPGRSRDWKNHRKDPAGLLQSLYQRTASLGRIPALCRQGGGAKSKINPYALEAWQQRVLLRAADEKKLSAFDPKALDEAFLRWLASLSCLPKGPQLACEELEGKGIAVVIEARLDETHLDGAALLTTDGCPVIGLTLRHNRLDNFWFTLFHEIGHVLLHLTPDNPALFDSEIDQKKTARIETEADRFALDTLIRPTDWEEVRHLNFAAEIRAAAARLRIHPAVIAGRLRREENDFRKHRTLIGSGETRAAFGFTEEGWPK